jgi:hypothetical protein
MNAVSFITPSVVQIRAGSPLKLRDYIEQEPCPNRNKADSQLILQV